MFEPPISVYEISKERNPLIGFFYGIPVGIGRGLFRASVGVVEIFTFPFEPYGPTVEPEFLFFGNDNE